MKISGDIYSSAVKEKLQSFLLPNITLVSEDLFTAMLFS